MSGGIDTNAAAVAARYRRVQAAVRAELVAEAQGLAARVAARMRVAAPKAFSSLANSVRATRNGPLDWHVGPHVDYAGWVERGRKPGKGLPFFGTPAAAGATAWLEQRVLRAARLLVNPKYRPGRAGSARRSAEDLELRVQYFFLSAAIKRRGIKPQPYVKPTADEFRTVVPDALLAAVRRGIALAGSATGPAPQGGAA